MKAGPTSTSLTRLRKPLFWLCFIALFGLYLLLAFAISEVTPFNKGPDEGINLDYIEFIATRGRLPVTYEERAEVGPKANWPALYHLLVAGLSQTLGVDMAGPPYIKIFWDSFRYRAMDVQTEDSWYLLSEDQLRPYRGRILALHLGRWLSILFSAGTLLILYMTLRELWPARPWLALFGTAVLAFIPTFIFMGAVLNEDALVAMLTALYFWMLIRIIKDPGVNWPYWVMGIALGLSVTAKYTTVVLPLAVIGVVAALARREGHSWRWGFRRLLIVGGSALLASAWWFGWNLWFLNEVEELGWVAGLLRPLFTGGTDVTLSRLGNFFSGGQIGLSGLPEEVTVGTFPEWLSITFLTFWGINIGGLIPLSPYIYLAIGLLLGLAGWGLWRLWRQETSAHFWLILFAGHLALFCVAPLVRFWLSGRLGQTAQGRHILIPAAVAIVVLLVWGLARLAPPRWQPWGAALIVVGLIGWSGLHLQRLSSFYPPYLPFRTHPQAAASLTRPPEAQFGEAIKLVGYELEPHPESGALALTLAWQTASPINENYLLDVALLDQEGRVVSFWRGYNGQGRVPTLAWEPGDIIFDRLSLPLPGLPAGAYTVQLQLLARTGPLPVNPETDPAEALALAQVSLETPSQFTYPHSLSSTGTGEVDFALWPAAQSSYRYPATISIVTSKPDLEVTLIDSTGQSWPSAHSQNQVHTFIIGPRWPSSAYHLQIADQTGNKTESPPTAEAILTVENWWKRRFETPAIATPMEANFANQLRLLGYSLPGNQIKAGEAFPLTLYWQALPDIAPQADFIQFNHLLDGQGNLWGGYDRQPLEYYSTLLWAPGEVVIDGYAVPVAADAPPGDYYLDVGFYLRVGESAVNLPLVVDGKRTDVTGVTIGPIHVVAP